MAYQLYRVTALVVEDNQPMMEIAKSLLETFGIGRVITAQDGEEGFEAYKRYNPDLILADWMMQPMDGIAFTRHIRSDTSAPNPYVPIILMTGFSEKRRVIEARDAGVTEFLVKPFTARDLYRRIVQVIERPRQFVRSGDFFGPDRRRKAKDGQEYGGPLRRGSDLSESAARKKIEEQKKKASATLSEIREQAGLNKGDRFDINPEDIELR